MAKSRESGMPDESYWGTFFNPECIVGKLDCTGSIDVVEFGCGYGHFTIPAAKLVGGKVYALDIDPQMVEVTRRRAEKAGLDNLVVEERDVLADGCGRPDGSVGYVMLFNILHVEDPVALLREAYRALAPGGLLGVIHWKHDPATPRGPSMSIRPQLEECRRWAEEAGFAFRRGEDLCCCSWHWGDGVGAANYSTVRLARPSQGFVSVEVTPCNCSPRVKCRIETWQSPLVSLHRLATCSGV